MKTTNILIRVSPEERAEIHTLADQYAGGNMSLLVRTAVHEYGRRRMVVDVTTEYQAESQQEVL